MNNSKINTLTHYNAVDTLVSTIILLKGLARATPT